MYSIFIHKLNVNIFMYIAVFYTYVMSEEWNTYKTMIHWYFGFIFVQRKQR